MTTLAIVDTCVQPARWNVAVTAALAEFRRADRIPDTLRFHRYPRSVLLGLSQEAAGAVDAIRCRERDVEVARRVTGGGAVYMDGCALAWDLVADWRRYARTPADAGRRLAEIVTRVLGTLGIAAEFAPPGDIRIGDRKVCGLSGFIDGRIAVQQASLLMSVRPADMRAVLSSSADGRSPALRVTALDRHCRSRPIVDGLRSALVHAMRDVWRVSVEATALDDGVARRAEQMHADEIGTDAFVWGDYAAARGEVRTAQVCAA